MGCRPQKETVAPAVQGVAEVGDAIITAEDFQSSMQQRAGRDPGRFANVAEKQALLADLIDQQAVYEKARSCGFAQTPEIQQSIRQLIIGRFLEAQARKQSGNPVVTDAEIKEYYAEHQDKYRASEKLRGAIIFRRKPAGISFEKRAELAARMQTILQEASSASNSAAFARVVENYSEDQATRYRGGDLGWISPEAGSPKLDSSVERALSALKEPNEFAPVISTEAGFYIVKLIERQPATVRPLTQLREEIRFRLFREKQEQLRRDLVANLRAGLVIRTNLELVASIPPPTPHSAPSPLAVPDAVNNLAQ